MEPLEAVSPKLKEEVQHWALRSERRGQVSVGCRQCSGSWSWRWSHGCWFYSIYYAVHLHCACILFHNNYFLPKTQRRYLRILKKKTKPLLFYLRFSVQLKFTASWTVAVLAFIHRHRRSQGNIPLNQLPLWAAEQVTTPLLVDIKQKYWSLV